MTVGETRITLRMWHKDIAGQKPADFNRGKLVGTRWFHPKTGGLYFVEGFSFDGERERWMILYRKEQTDDCDNLDDTDFPFSHLPEDFFREGRFLQVMKGT